MNTYILLFRGINVGGKNILPMKELVAILESLDYENVRTYIQSGNVVFQSKNSVSETSIGDIGKAILERKGFEPTVMLLGAEQLRDAIENNPFPTSEGKALHFFFMESQPNQPNLERLESLKIESEQFELRNKIFYLYTPDGIGRSKLAAAVEKALGVAVTARNWNTVRKLASMAEVT